MKRIYYFLLAVLAVFFFPVLAFAQESSDFVIDFSKIHYDVDTSSMEEGLILMPKLASNADMLFVLKPKEKEKAKKEIDDLFDMFLTQYEMYYEEEYQKLKDKTVKEQDGYLIYIVSNESDQVLKAIEENH